MTTRSREPMHVTSETELPELLDHAEHAPLLLEREGVLFRLAREDEEDIAYEPSSELVRQMLAETVGSWAELDADELIADIYEARKAGSRPPERP